MLKYVKPKFVLLSDRWLNVSMTDDTERSNVLKWKAILLLTVTAPFNYKQTLKFKTQLMVVYYHQLTFNSRVCAVKIICIIIIVALDTASKLFKPCERKRDQGKHKACGVGTGKGAKRAKQRIKRL